MNTKPEKVTSGLRIFEFKRRKKQMADCKGTLLKMNTEVSCVCERVLGNLPNKSANHFMSGVFV